MSHKFEAGRLQNFVHEWHKITNDSHILDIIAHCHLDINVDDISHLFSEGIEYVFSEEEKSHPFHLHSLLLSCYHKTP